MIKTSGMESQNIEYKESWKDDFLCKMSANQTCLNLPNHRKKTQFTGGIYEIVVKNNR